MIPMGDPGQGCADPLDPDRNPERHGGAAEEVRAVKIFQRGGGWHALLWANHVKRSGGTHHDPQLVDPDVRRDFLDRFFELRDLVAKTGRGACEPREQAEKPSPH